METQIDHHAKIYNLKKNSTTRKPKILGDIMTLL
jgi:hypothetical protein